MHLPSSPLSCFFLHVPATTDIYTLSLHDALPIYLQLAPRPALARHQRAAPRGRAAAARARRHLRVRDLDRKSTRLNSSHLGISYAVFCLKKKKTRQELIIIRQNTDYQKLMMESPR